MDWKELFTAEAERVLGYYVDLKLLVFAPRRFLAIVIAEPPLDFIRRVIVYAVTYGLLEFTVFSFALPSVSLGSLFKIAGLILFEIVFGLLLFPSFFLASKVARAEQPTKTALIYSILFRYVYQAPSLVFYGLFVMTEDYSFALLRGVAAYAGQLTYVVILPVGLAITIRRHAATLVVTVFAFAVTLGLVGLITSNLSTKESKLLELSMLYDPIGGEVDKLDLDLGDTSRELGLTELTTTYSLADPNQKDTTIRFEPGAVARWKTNCKTLESRWSHEIDRLKEQRASCVFTTTKHFIDLRINELSEAIDLIHQVDLVIDQQSHIQALNACKDSYIKLLDSIIKVLKEETEFYSLRNKLGGLWLLF